MATANAALLAAILEDNVAEALDKPQDSLNKTIIIADSTCNNRNSNSNGNSNSNSNRNDKSAYQTMTSAHATK